MYRLLIVVIPLMFLFCPVNLLAKGSHGKGHKGPNPEAYEHANEHARFKRDANWVENLGTNKDKELMEEGENDKVLKKEKKKKHKKLKKEERELTKDEKGSQGEMHHSEIMGEGMEKSKHGTMNMEQHGKSLKKGKHPK